MAHTGAPPMTSLKFVMTHDGVAKEIRRLAVPAYITYDAVRSRAELLLGHASFALQYVDDENELVTIGSAAEWDECVGVAQAMNIQPMRVRVAQNSPDYVIRCAQPAIQTIRVCQTCLGELLVPDTAVEYCCAANANPSVVNADSTEGEMHSDPLPATHTSSARSGDAVSSATSPAQVMEGGFAKEATLPQAATHHVDQVRVTPHTSVKSSVDDGKEHGKENEREALVAQSSAATYLTPALNTPLPHTPSATSSDPVVEVGASTKEATVPQAAAHHVDPVPAKFKTFADDGKERGKEKDYAAAAGRTDVAKYLTPSPLDTPLSYAASAAPLQPGFSASRSFISDATVTPRLAESARKDSPAYDPLATHVRKLDAATAAVSTAAVKPPTPRAAVPPIPTAHSPASTDAREVCAAQVAQLRDMGLGDITDAQCMRLRRIGLERFINELLRGGQ